MWQVDAAVAKKMYDYILFKIEESDRNWMQFLLGLTLELDKFEILDKEQFTSNNLQISENLFVSATLS